MINDLCNFLGRVLSRRTSGRALIPEVDGLRTIAILSVVFFHANASFQYYAGDRGGVDGGVHRLLETGEYGVPLFFVISGFILAIPFARYHLDGANRVSLKKYLVRRLTRLEPPYIFALLAFFVIGVVRSGSIEKWDHLLASGGYVHNAIFGEASAILVVAWSLEVEVQFYLLAPFLAMVFAIGNVLVRRGILILGIGVLSAFFNVHKPIDGLALLSHGSYFLVGLLLADIYLADGRRHRLNGEDPSDQHVSVRTRGGWGYDALAFVSLSMIFVSDVVGIGPQYVGPWLILIGYASVFRARVVRHVFRWPPIVIVGGMCYTIYLWHFFFIAGFRHVWFRVMPTDLGLVSRVGYVLVASCVAVGLSAVLFALIERPTMDPKWPGKLWGIVTGKGKKDAEQGLGSEAG